MPDCILNENIIMTWNYVRSSLLTRRIYIISVCLNVCGCVRLIGALFK